MTERDTNAWPWPGELLSVAALGALQTVAYVHTWAWPVQALCMAVLAWRVMQASVRRAAVLGLVYGSAWMGAGVWWLFISMHRYGGLPAPVAALAVVVLAVVLGLYLAVASAIFARARRGHVLVDATLFALAWLVAELARGLLFTGFPWLSSGYGQVDGPLAAWAPWVGVYGIGAWLAFCAGLVAALALEWQDRPPVAVAQSVRALPALAVLALPGLIGDDAVATQPAGSLRVTLLQTMVPQDEKFALQRLPQSLAELADMLAAAEGDLVVAPETAVPLLPSQLREFDPDYWPRLQARFAAPGGPLALLGVPLGDFASGYTNSVVGLGARTPYRYDKSHLVPFGEFVPRGTRWFVDLMAIPLGDFDRGPVDAPSFTVGRQRVAPNICYEDLFGEELARRFADASAQPTVLANLSNIGWFGNTIAVDQHLNISRMRTLELQRPMIRATNTGATAIIDHRGRVSVRLPAYQRGVAVGVVEGRRGRTPYAAWVGAMGLWPVLGAALLMLGWAAVVGPRSGRGGDGSRSRLHESRAGRDSRQPRDSRRGDTASDLRPTSRPPAPASEGTSGGNTRPGR